MKTTALIVLSILALATSACKTTNFSEEDIEKAAQFASCVKGCYDATEADPELLQP